MCHVALCAAPLYEERKEIVSGAKSVPAIDGEAASTDGMLTEGMLSNNVESACCPSACAAAWCGDQCGIGKFGEACMNFLSGAGSIQGISMAL